MKKVVILLAVLFFLTVLLGCVGQKIPENKNLKHDAWIYEGWACGPGLDKSKAPLQIGCEQKEFLYMTFLAAASEDAVDSGAQKRMAESCRNGANHQFQSPKKFLRVFGAFLEKTSGVIESSQAGGYELSALKVLNSGRTKSIGLYNCCALDKQSGRCVKPERPQNWGQCICMGFIEIKGGSKYLDTVF